MHDAGAWARARASAISPPPPSSRLLPSPGVPVPACSPLMDITIEPGVAGAEHLAHAACADRGHNFVVTEAVTRGQRHEGQNADHSYPVSFRRSVWLWTDRSLVDQERQLWRSSEGDAAGPASRSSSPKRRLWALRRRTSIRSRWAIRTAARQRALRRPAIDFEFLGTFGGQLQRIPPVISEANKKRI